MRCPHCGGVISQGKCMSCGALVGQTNAANVLAANRARLRGTPGVIGTMSRGGNIIVTVTDPGIAIPSSIDGVAVVKKVGLVPRITDHRTRTRPVVGGVSTGPPSSATGTLGCIIDHNGEYYYLSNNHVFALCNAVPLGSSILQPGFVDGGESPIDIAGELVGYVPYQASPVVNIVDMALAKPLAEYEQSILEIGVAVGVTEAVEGQRVHKSGRTTGVTSGLVVSTDAEIVVNAEPLWSRGLLVFEDQIVIEGDYLGEFSAPGDSGSAILDDDNNLVGLLFAGTEDATIANKMTNVLSRIDEALSVQEDEGKSEFPILGVLGAACILGFVASRS